MTPEQKAKELVKEFSNYNEYTIDAQACALIAVELEYTSKIKAYKELEEFAPDVAMQAIIYCKREFEQVKTEIEKL